MALGHSLLGQAENFSAQALHKGQTNKFFPIIIIDNKLSCNLPTSFHRQTNFFKIEKPFRIKSQTTE